MVQSPPYLMVHGPIELSIELCMVQFAYLMIHGPIELCIELCMVQCPAYLMIHGPMELNPRLTTSPEVMCLPLHHKLCRDVTGKNHGFYYQIY